MPDIPHNLIGPSLLLIFLPALIIGWLVGAEGGAEGRGIVNSGFRAWIRSTLFQTGLLGLLQLPMIPNVDWNLFLWSMVLVAGANVFAAVGPCLMSYNLTARQEAQNALERMQKEALESIRESELQR